MLLSRPSRVDGEGAIVDAAISGEAVGCDGLGGDGEGLVSGQRLIRVRVAGTAQAGREGRSEGC